MNSDLLARRLDRLRERLRDDGISALLVSRAVNVSYLTGFTGDSSFLLVTADRAILISDHRFAIQLQDECPTTEVFLRGHDKNTYQAVGEVVSKLGLANVAVESAGLTLSEFELLGGLCGSSSLVSRGRLVENLRAIKDADELDRLRRAIADAEAAFSALRSVMRPTDTEKDCADLLDGFMKRRGSAGLAFPPIVGVGARSALPHCPVSDRRLETAEFVLVDWGSRTDQYHSDLTRVIRTPGQVLSTDVETQLRKIYTVVSTAQERAIALLRPGADVRDVDRAARGTIADAGFGDYFNHGLGHGIGLEIHEAPSIRSNSTDRLAAGMVVTIEPGIYLPDFGGVRIEDDILITADGPEILTSVSRRWEDL